MWGRLAVCGPGVWESRWCEVGAGVRGQGPRGCGIQWVEGLLLSTVRSRDCRGVGSSHDV